MYQSIFSLLLLVFLFAACEKPIAQSEQKPEFVINEQFQQLIHESGINEGIILVYKPGANQYITNDSSLVNIGHLPASTFKIANSIVGLELGLTSLDRIFPWNGEQHYLDAWEQDLNFKQAFGYSCVPCYQQLAREIGAERMRNKLNELGYPTMDTREQTIDNFWLTGPSRITPMQQIDFLQRLHEGKLPIKKNTYDVMHEIMQRNELGAKLYGKTGMSISEDDLRNGWFVGFLVTDKEPIYFATNLNQTNEISNNQFIRARIELTLQALKSLGLN